MLLYPLYKCTWSMPLFSCYYAVDMSIPRASQVPYDMHMVSIRVRYGFRWHSDKPYRTSRRRVRYGLSECHLNPYRTRMDIICIFSHEITINLSFTTKKHIIEISQPPHRVWYGVRSELCLTLQRNRGVREVDGFLLNFRRVTCRKKCVDLIIEGCPEARNIHIYVFC